MFRHAEQSSSGGTDMALQMCVQLCVHRRVGVCRCLLSRHCPAGAGAVTTLATVYQLDCADQACVVQAGKPAVERVELVELSSLSSCRACRAVERADSIESIERVELVECVLNLPSSLPNLPSSLCQTCQTCLCGRVLRAGRGGRVLIAPTARAHDDRGRAAHRISLTARCRQRLYCARGARPAAQRHEVV